MAAPQARHVPRHLVAEEAIASGLGAIVSQAILAAGDELRGHMRTIVREALDEMKETSVEGGQPADTGTDPLLSMSGICRRYGFSRHSKAAEEARKRLPWIEVSEGRFMCRTSAADAYFQPKEGAAKAA